MKVADFFKKAGQSHRQDQAEAQPQTPNYYDSNDRSTRKRSGGLTAVQILYWLCWGAFFWFAYLNINPYAQAASFILSTISDNTLVQWFLGWPVIGALLASVALASHWIIGAIVWGLIQTIEVLPIILSHDRGFMRTVIIENDKSDRFAVAPTDSPTIKALKVWYNLFPSTVISKARKWRKVTYAIDAMICLLVYPPAASVSEFFFLLTTGQWYALQWNNIALTIVTLFAIEILVYVLLFAGQVVYHYRLSAQYRQ